MITQIKNTKRQIDTNLLLNELKILSKKYNDCYDDDDKLDTSIEILSIILNKLFKEANFKAISKNTFMLEKMIMQYEFKKDYLILDINNVMSFKCLCPILLTRDLKLVVELRKNDKKTSYEYIKLNEFLNLVLETIRSAF